MASRTRSSIRVGLGLLLALTVLLGIAGSPASAAGPTKILFLMDVSGSMNEKLPGGQTKLAAAKQAIKQVAGSLPAGAQVGLRVYGSKISQPQSVNPKACRDTDLVMPIGPLNRSRLDNAVDSFKAVGETPIAYSMTKAVGDLGSSGRRVLILVSDGEENCVKDPCPTAKRLAGSGVDIQFNAVGFNVDDKARKELRCIAGAGGGSYYDANESGSLTESLQKITTRALRPFRMTGTRVSGTADPSSAPTLGDGQYLDSFSQSTTRRYYKIDRQPGAAVTVSLADVNAPTSASGSSTDYAMTLRTPDGTICDNASAGSTSYQSAMVTTVVVGAPSPGGSAAGPCATGPLVLEVVPAQLLDAQGFRIELVVSSTPPATNAASLPGPGAKPGKAGKVAAGRSAKRVVGGSSFVDAAPIGPGTYTDTIAVGETLFYKVPLTWGQRLKVTADLPQPGTPWSPDPADGFYPGLELSSPDRATLDRQSKSVTGFTGAKASFSTQTAQVRYRNRESSDPAVRWVSRDGDYYIAVTLGALQHDVSGRLMRIRLRVDVIGTKTGVPTYAVSSPSPTPSASAGATPTGQPATPSDGAKASAAPGRTGSGIGIGPVLGIIAAVIVLAGGIGIVIGRKVRKGITK
ncbi:MAG: VWA domain-containing protein [Microlunatus sp.]|nr:VWA domain-containing protein [Microlunatus sp.]